MVIINYISINIIETKKKQFQVVDHYFFRIIYYVNNKLYGNDNIVCDWNYINLTGSYIYE